MEAARLRFGDLTPGRSSEIIVDVAPDGVRQFAALSGDQAPVHTDIAHANALGFSVPIAHGALIGAYVSQLIGMHLPGAYGVLQSLELEFRRPVLPPARLTVRGEVVSASAAVKQVTIKIDVRSDDGVLVASGRARSIVRDDAA